MRKTKASRVFSISLQTIYNWLALEENQGHLKPKEGYQKGHSHKITDLIAFKVYVDKHPDHTQEEIASYYSVGSSTVGRAMEKIGYTRKKKPNLLRKKRG